MTLAFTDDRDAFLAVLALVMGADQQGSFVERDYLVGEVRTLPLFDGVEPAEFGKLLGDVTERVYTAVPQQDGALSPAGVDTLLSHAKDVLGPDLCRAAVRCATGLSAVDGSAAEEDEMLARIRRTLA